MENNTNNIQITDMDCWAVDDWAAFGISLWTLQRKIKEDPAYISEARLNETCSNCQDDQHTYCSNDAIKGNE